MSEDTNFQNNPLHGVGLQGLLTILVEHYGFEIMFAYLNINCFKINASVDSSAKFLKKTDWAREKVESFYLYEYCNLPRASAKQFEMPPRDRIMPAEQKPGTPAELSLEDAERLREKREKKAAMHDQESAYGSSSNRGGGSYRGDNQRAGASRGNSHSYSRDDNRPRRDKASSAPIEKGSDPWANWKK